VLQEDEDSSTSLKDDAGASVEEVPIAVDEITVFGAAAIETTAVVELANNVIAVVETASDAAAATAFDVFEEVNVVAVAAEGAVKEPEEVVTAGIAGDDRLTQGDSSRNGDYANSALLDLSPPTRFYVKRSRCVNVVSSDSKRTPSVSAALLTLRASQSEFAGASSMHVTPATSPIAMDALLGAPGTENIQEDEENVAAPYHISDIDTDHATEGITATGVISATEVPAAEHIESEVEVIPTTEFGSDISVMEGTFAQDPNDDAPLEDMADVHDSYDAVLADVQDQDA
jgi:hypothetical protein